MAIPGFGPAAAASGQTTGVLMILAALVSYGFAINLAGPLQQRNGALPVIWRAQAVAIVLTAPLGAPAALNGTWSLRPVLALLALGALGTCVANVVAATAAGRLGATRASASTFLMPVVALILGVVVRGERVALISVIGAAVCLIGAALVRRASAHAASKPAGATRPAVETASAAQ
jgi:drug/metabolite transporter (DMT)-like permease